MCLAIPGKVTELLVENDLPMARVDFGGIVKPICIAHVPDLAIGDYALVHVGFAIGRIDEAEARRIFAMLESSEALDELRQVDADEVP